VKQPYEILRWDTDFFGYPVAKIHRNNLSDQELIECLAFLKQDVRLVYYASANKIQDNTLLLKEFNGLLVDRKTTFYKEGCLSNAYSDKYTFEYNDNFNLHELLQLGIASGIYSRYKIDPNIEEIKYEALYKEWMINSIEGILADKVLVYVDDNTILGVITLDLKSNHNLVNIGIISVRESARGKGIGKTLLRAAEEFAVKNKASKIQVVTQGANKAACALYNSYGYRIEKVEYFYHFWL